MVKIVTDLDGVLRDLMAYINSRWEVKNPESWNWTVDGKNIFDLAKEFPEILFLSPKTPYFETIVKFYKPGKVPIWSAQPEDWKILTKAWCDKHIGIDKYDLEFLKPEEKYQRLLDNPNTLLIEDSPNFPKYDQIILIDTIQNEKNKAKIRVKTNKELQEVLDGF